MSNQRDALVDYLDSHTATWDYDKSYDHPVGCLKCGPLSDDQTWGEHMADVLKPVFRVEIMHGGGPVHSSCMIEGGGQQS